MLTRAKADRDRISRRREMVAAELRDLDAQLSKLAGFIEMFQQYAGAGAATSPPTRRATRGSRVRMPSNTDLMVRAAAEAIQIAGRPLSISELVRAVESAGFAIGGVRPATNLSSKLGRSGIVKFDDAIRAWRVVPGETGDRPLQGELAEAMQSPVSVTGDHDV
jgi:hypothetical protein